MRKKSNEHKEAQKAIIFDFDDTLINTKCVSLDKHKEAAKRLNIDFDENELIKRWGKPWPSLLYEFLGKNTDKFVKLMDNLEDFKFEQINGAADSISYAKKKNFFLGILTSSERKWVMKKAKDASIDLGLFEDWLIFCNEDVDEHKPDPEVFKNAIEKLAVHGIKKEAVYYCGDNLVDFEAAKNAGINFIAVTTGFTKKEDFVKAGMSEELILPSVKELPFKLEMLNII